jgi:MFS family permease
LAILAFAQLLIALDFSIVYVALPSMAGDLGLSPNGSQWIVSAYALTFGGFLLFGGRAADLMGRRRVFVVALAIYSGSSFVAGLAQHAVALVLVRGLQGFGCALLFPATLALINTTFRVGLDRIRAIAVWGAAGASGGAIGALAGGLLTSELGWESIFYINAPLAGGAAVIARWVLEPDPLTPGRRRAYDVGGAITATSASLFVVYALIQAPQRGWNGLHVIAPLLLGVIMTTCFFSIERRSADALMPLSLLGNRHLVVAALLTAIFMASFGAQSFPLTVWFQDIRGMTPFGAGLAFLPLALSVVAGTHVGGRTTNRHGPRVTLLVGNILGAVGFTYIAVQLTAFASYLALLPGIIVVGLGQGIVWTAMWIVAGTGVASKDQGIASGVASTTQQIGGAIGLAAVVAVVTWIAQGAVSATELARGLRGAFVATALFTLLGALTAFAIPRTATGKGPFTLVSGRSTRSAVD